MQRGKMLERVCQQFRLLHHRQTVKCDTLSNNEEKKKRANQILMKVKLKIIYYMEAKSRSKKLLTSKAFVYGPVSSTKFEPRLK